MTASAPIRVLCVDDHPVMRAGVVAVVAGQHDMSVIAQAGNCAEALEAYKRHRPDVAIVDLRLPDCEGAELIERIRAEFSQARIVVLSTFNGDADIHRAIQAGARAYLVKSMDSAELLNAIRTVHQGLKHIAPEIAARLVEHTPRIDLSPRERQVLEMIARGLRNKEIGFELGISEETVKGYVKTILSKLDVSDRTEAVTTALRRGFISL